MYAQVSEDLFEAYALKAEKEREARENRGSGNSYQPREDVKWHATQVGIPSIVRIVGAPLGMSDDPSTMRSVFISMIKGDDGKMFKVVHPDPRQEPDYIINKIINRVMAPKWNNGVKYFPVKDEFPEIYNIVEKNGFKPEEPRYKFDRGWRGVERLIIPVISRTEMDWHRENKKVMLLARNITVRDDGTEWVDEGVSTYTYMPKLEHLIRSYGSLERIDLAIVRGNSIESPVTIVNASNSPREVAKDYQKYISTVDHLTDEELSWDRPNLTEIYKNTSATRIFNKLQQTIKKIDASLNTDYYGELLDLVEKEKIERTEKESQIESYTSTSMVADEPVKEIIKEEKTETSTDDLPWEEKEIEETPKVTTRTTRTRVPKVEEKTHAAWMDLPYGDSIPDEYKPKVLEVVKNKDGIPVDVKWDVSDDEELAECFNEEYEYPDGTKHKCTCLTFADMVKCPICGQEY